MFIELNKISSKGLEVIDSVALEGNLLLEEQGFFVRNIDYQIRFHRDGNKIRALGNIKTILSLPCVSCLTPFEMNIDSNFDIILLPVDKVALSNTSLTDDDMEYIFFEGDRIDLAKILLEQVNLVAPGRPVCNPDCKGLCPSCGVNLNYESCQCENSFKEVNFLFNNIKR